MSRSFALALGALPLLAGACNPPNVTPARAVVELYMHPNGLSNCVDENDGRWKNDPSCCPDGFEFVGFKVPAAVEYPKDDKTTRRLEPQPRAGPSGSRDQRGPGGAQR